MRLRRRSQVDSDTAIGAVTICLGDYPYLKGRQVRIIAVWKGALKPDFDPDAEDAYIRGDEHLARLGGLDAFDTVEVETCEKGQRRVSTGTVKATDLALFREPHQQHLFPRPPEKIEAGGN